MGKAESHLPSPFPDILGVATGTVVQWPCLFRPDSFFEDEMTVVQGLGPGWLF